MTSAQSRILFELAIGRLLKRDPETDICKWNDGRAKPPLERRVTKQLFDKGLIVDSHTGFCVITTVGAEMLQRETGRQW